MSGNQESNIGQQPAQIANQGSGTKKRKSYPTQERVRELFDYDPDTGALVCRVKNLHRQVLGTKTDKGRLRRVTVDGQEYEYKAILWLWYYGEPPEGYVTLRDYSKSNYRIDNLILYKERKALPLTQEIVRFLLDYDPLTGVVTRKVQTSPNCAVGEIENNFSKSGYRTISLEGRRYSLHRVIWLWYYGYFPENVIDHINRNRLDCSIKNLREVSQKCNARNSSVPITNTSGVKGVGWYKDYGKWTVSVKSGEVTKRLGYFTDFTEAVAHRLAAEQALDWSGCDSNSSAYQYMQNYLKGLRDAK